MAANAYAHDRYEQALREVRAVVDVAPSSATVRELYGLTLYRLGRWREAARQLEELHRLTGSFDQHPVIADCHRAMGHHRRVEAIYDELRRSSPSPDVLVEGRLVLAGTKADRGDLAGAIEVLAPAPSVAHPAQRHLRLWYALADIYERAGDVSRAREYFLRIVRHDPDSYDAAERLVALT
ncbi:MAG: tetratricopeptide repeat protein [Actinomycetota bacterium]|nr:tetratricopeptide repeat protein [Actinomycetota bacterium]